MGLIDSVLNLAGLLLWLSWQALRFDPLAGKVTATLVGTLKPAEPRRGRGWRYLAGLLLLLVVRAWAYWHLAPAADWTPKVELGVVVLAFRGDSLGSELVFSALSFARVLVLFYLWVLTLVLLEPRGGEADPLARRLRLYMGRVSRWAWPVQVLLPGVVVTGAWLALHPLLLRFGVSNPSPSLAHLIEQGLLVSLELYLSLKYLLVPLLLLHLVASYVYLGNNPFWEFLSGVSRRLLAPIQSLPLRVGRVDLSPLVGAGLLLALLHWGPMLLRNVLARHQVSWWPQ